MLEYFIIFIGSITTFIYSFVPLFTFMLKFFGIERYELTNDMQITNILGKLNGICEYKIDGKDTGIILSKKAIGHLTITPG